MDMAKSLEDTLLQAIRIEDLDTITCILSKGANPNRAVSHGRTCLGEAANIGNIDIIKLLISACQSSSTLKGNSNAYSRKRSIKCHKRKLKHEGESSEVKCVKCKTLNDKVNKDKHSTSQSLQEDRNQGYFVFIHSDGSSSDESKLSSLKSPISSTSLTPSPQEDLEWDEDIGNVAPSTTEDETWSSMYKWYAAILESTGAAIAAASLVTNGIDQQDAFARTALHYAVEQGHLGVVKLLIDAGCKVDVTAGDGLTPLHIAIIKNDAEVAKLLLASGSNVNYKTHEKMTPLHFAASRGLSDLVKILVRNGAYLEARDTNERTALYLAAGRGHVDIVKHLISCGANVNGEEIHGYTPLCEAVWQKYAAVVEVLLNNGARLTYCHRLLHDAIANKQEDIVRMLTNSGGAINLHNEIGDTPLLLAVRSSQPNIVKILLQKGANPNACNNITGASALHVAVESVSDPKVFEEILRTLLEYKVDMNALALTGDTPLNRAMLLLKDHAAVLLIRYGADVNACELYSCGLDNLSIAIRRKTNTLASMLFKAGHQKIPIERFECEISNRAVTWLYNAFKQPLSLSDICRIRIRQSGSNIVLFKYIDNLPLPSCLKRFLLMENED